MTNAFGVVSLKNTGNSQASGVLLWTGQHILTCAHFFDGIKDPALLEIQFNSSLNISASVKSFIQHPGWARDPQNYDHDLAIIELDSPVNNIQGYDIYRNFDEIGQFFERTGFSQTINPSTGAITNNTKQFLSGTNRYDTTTDIVNPLLGTNISKDLQLAYDYDNGLSAQDALGSILGSEDLGTGNNEFFSQHGDSGSPAFINQQIAGIASYIFRYDNNGKSADITSSTDASYGEIASDGRVSKYTNWIDSVVSGSEFTEKKPTQKEAVEVNPIEGDTQNTINYFLLQLDLAIRTDASVNYITVDGTAKAGSDYIAKSGTATIPAGSTYIAIPIEIIADTVVENEEFFSLKVTNPQGGVFPEGITELTAQHTIIDNDHSHGLSRSLISHQGIKPIIDIVGVNSIDSHIHDP